MRKISRYLARLWAAVTGRTPPATATPRSRQATGALRRAIERARRTPFGTAERGEAFMQVFPLPAPPKGVPEDVKIAMDLQIQDVYSGASWGAFGEGISFPGFAYLSELFQRPEYRMILEIRAEEMTRKWIELEYDGEGDDETQKAGAAKIKELNDAMEQFQLRERFRRMAELDGGFGHAFLYPDIKDYRNQPSELKTPLVLKSQKIPKGSLNGFVCVEPIWIYPNIYNSDKPLDPTFFRPKSWFVNNLEVDKSRIMRFCSREMPDLLKPAYAFAGLSLSQMAQPYVNNWLRTRQSVSDLVHAFSILVLLTNMGATLEDWGDDDGSLDGRLELFNLNRDNRGIFAIDKETEDLKNLAVPLGTLDKLQAQSQEQLASVSGTPLTKLLGVTPTGLNATGEGEIRVFYDKIAALQQQFFGDPLRMSLEIIQLHLWGEIDPRIKHKFVQLMQLDEAAQAAVEKTEMDTDAVAVQNGILDPEEVRRALANQRGGRYAGIEVADVPEIETEDPAQEGVSANPARTAGPSTEKSIA